MLISCAYIMFLPVEITDSHRNTVPTICRSSVFQSISELATSFSLSSIELLGDECEGMYAMAGSFFMREKVFFPHWCSHFLPPACFYFLYIQHVVVLRSACASTDMFT